jgi:hypothetical protein
VANVIPVARRETGDVWTLDGYPVVVEDGVIANSGVVDGHGQVLAALALAVVEGIDVRRRDRVAVEEVRDVGVDSCFKVHGARSLFFEEMSAGPPPRRNAGPSRRPVL